MASHHATRSWRSSQQSEAERAIEAAAEAASIPERSLIVAADALGVRTKRGQLVELGWSFDRIEAFAAAVVKTVARYREAEAEAKARMARSSVPIRSLSLLSFLAIKRNGEDDMLSARLTPVLAAALLLAGISGSTAQGPKLDYGFFKSAVEPIFLQKRPGHTRCYICHSENNSVFHLERLSPGATFWSDEQSRKNFNFVSALVVPGNPAQSRLLLHPLAPEAGGDLFHSGGRQFASKDDSDWKILAQWVSGKTAAAK